MSSENYENLYFSEETIRLTVLTNICRMMVMRGYMDINKYKKPSEDPDNSDLVDAVTVSDSENPDNSDSENSDNSESVNAVIIRSPISNKIDNSLFLPFIEARVDNNTYVFPMDKPYRDQREGKADANADFDGTSVIVKIIPQVVKDITNSPLLNDFFKTYPNNHKIVVFDGLADKVYSLLNKKRNIEVFDRDYLMIDLMAHTGAPVWCELVTEKDIAYITNPKIAKIHENDPLCRYYNGKKGMIMRIISPSLNNSEEIRYRKIIEPKPVFK